MKKIIDLRSDTVTKPCRKMLQAIMTATVGDNYYKEDQVTNELEKHCADYFGVEEALFMVTGTMANQVALRCNTVAGEEVIADKYSHIVYYCARPVADLAKISLNIVDAKEGVITLDDILTAKSTRYRSDLVSYPKLIWLENTINHYSGKIYPLDELKKIYKFSKENGLKIHMDGARLLNACIAGNISPRAYTQYTDSMTVSFSKALGAPAGSILLGRKKLISHARVYQKWYGGGLHQSGVLASTCLFALQNNINCISVDHQNAKLLAQLSTQDLDRDIILMNPVETNIVMFNIKELKISVDTFIDMAKDQSILLYRWNDSLVRAVTHKDINRDEIVIAGEIINKIFKSIS
jgi:threonine aldolase